MKKKQEYKKYIHELACISIAAGSITFIVRSFPQFKDNQIKIQDCVNRIVPKWNHLGRWGKAVKVVNTKFEKWIKENIPEDSNLKVIDILSTVIALLVDLLPNLGYNEKGYIEELLGYVEELLIYFDEEEIDDSDRGLIMAQGF